MTPNSTVQNSSPLNSFNSVKYWISIEELIPFKTFGDSFFLIFPMSEQCKKWKTDSHLTHSTASEHQIRFALKERVDRDLDRFSYVLSEILPKNTSLPLDNFSPLDKGSRLLFELVKSSRPDINMIHKPILNKYDKSNLVCDLRECLYRGDYWAAEYAIKNNSNKLPVLFYIKGLVDSFFERIDSAETNFLNFRNTGSLKDKVNANYVLSMLYLRHHPAEKRSTNRAAFYLNEAWNILNRNPELFEDFDFVFNRNGYALVTFRNGEVDESIALLTWGIKKLEHSNTGSIPLHKSVLLYNLAQCYVAKSQYSLAIETYTKLLQIDFKMVEYHIDLAKVLDTLDESSKALKQCMTALKIDPRREEVLSMIAYLYSKMNKDHLAIKYSRLAFAINDSHENLYRLTYSLLKYDCTLEAFEILSKKVILNSQPCGNIDLDSAYAECLTRLNMLQELKSFSNHFHKISATSKAYEDFSNKVEVLVESA